MKNTGRIILSLFFIFICSGLYAAEIETELSPSRISVGESASLRIKITGKSSKVTPVKFPAIEGLQITFSGSSRSFQFINGKSWSGTVLNFSIYGEKKGVYKIPPFILEADGEQISSRQVSLIVGEASSSENNSSGSLRGDVEISTETVYVGEPFFIRYFIYGGDDSSQQIEGFSEQPHVKGFVMKGFDDKSDYSGKTFAGSFCLVPVDKGIHDIGGGSVDVTVETLQGIFSMSGRKRIKFPYKKIKVTPIPSAGKTDKFAGDVGEFKIEAQMPSEKFQIFEEIKIPVKVSGRGNFLTLSKPRIENEDGIKTVVEEKEQNLYVSEGGLSGDKNFLITVIPQKDGAVNPGRIFIEYFNPYKKSYERAESIPLSFEVLKGGNSGAKDEVRFSSVDSSKNNFSLYYAGLIIFGLAASVIGLVLWERKKIVMIKKELGSENVEEKDDSPVDITGEILKNIQTSLKEKNMELFLSNADRGINQIDPVKLSAAELSKYNLFKEKIYYCRYGGGAFADSEMKELGEWLKKNLK